jgi:sorting nexin-9/18/33
MPCLCEKTAKKTSVNTIEKRTVILELFLNELAKSEHFRNSKYFVDFLRLSDP